MPGPWLPVALMLIVLLGVWLGIVGPMPDGFAAWLQKWQTLAAATVASIAAYVAFQNTTRSLQHAEGLEKHRRSRKHASLRAVLPLALAQVTGYAARSAYALNELVNKCNGEVLPLRAASETLIEPLPSETLKTLADFIEYSDTVDVGVLESTVARIQIHDSRLRALVDNNHDASGTRSVVRAQIEALIIDAASIYAGATAYFNYGRRRQTELPRTLLWDAVRGALRNMRFWDDEHQRLHALVTRLENVSAGPEWWSTGAWGSDA
jgi:hypothetical protein